MLPPKIDPPKFFSIFTLMITAKIVLVNPRLPFLRFFVDNGLFISNMHGVIPDYTVCMQFMFMFQKTP